MTGVDAALVRNGSISGQVTDAATGAPLEGVCVGAGGFNLDPSRAPKTDANGRYRLEGVEPGDHLVLVQDCARDRGYLREYYPDFHGGNGSGKRVTVEPGGETGGIDVALDLAAEISGTVRAETGEPIPRRASHWSSPTPISAASSEAPSAPMGRDALPLNHCRLAPTT